MSQSIIQSVTSQPTVESPVEEPSTVTVGDGEEAEPQDVSTEVTSPPAGGVEVATIVDSASFEAGGVSTESVDGASFSKHKHKKKSEEDPQDGDAKKEDLPADDQEVKSKEDEDIPSFDLGSDNSVPAPPSLPPGAPPPPPPPPSTTSTPSTSSTTLTSITNA